MAKKRLIFCTYPSLYSSLVLKKLLADDAIEIVAIISSTRVLNKNYGSLRGAIKQIQLTGWRYSTYLFFVTDLFTVLSSLLFAGKKKLLTVSAYAKKHAIPIMQTADINDVEAIDFITSHQAGFLLAAHFNQLVKPAILEMPHLCCLNIHPSLLPDYKGVDPVLYAMLDNKQEIGVTVHKMAESFDTGKILSQYVYTLKPRNTVFTHNCRLFSRGAELAIDSIKQQAIPAGKAQEKGQGTYDSWPDSMRVKKLRQKAYKLINLGDYFRQVKGS